MAISKKRQIEITAEIAELTSLNGDFDIEPFSRKTGTMGYRLTREEGEYGKPTFAGFFTIFVHFNGQWVRAYFDYAPNISNKVLTYVKEIYDKNGTKVHEPGRRHRMLFGDNVKMKLVFAELTDELRAKIKRSRATYKDLDSFKSGKLQTLFNDEAVESSNTFNLLMKSKILDRRKFEEKRDPKKKQKIVQKGWRGKAELKTNKNIKPKATVKSEVTSVGPKKKVSGGFKIGRGVSNT